MIREALVFIACASGFVLTFVFAEFLRKRGVSAETTRKTVHVASGVGALTFPVLFRSVWSVVLLCALFFAFLARSARSRGLRSVHGVERSSWGAELFPIGVALLFVFAHSQGQWLLYYAPLIALAFADPAAALVGKRWPFLRYNVGRETQKTFSGSFACFLVCLAVVAMSHASSANASTAANTLGPACAATIAEAFGVRGTDNLFLPLAMAATMAIGSA